MTVGDEAEDPLKLNPEGERALFNVAEDPSKLNPPAVRYPKIQLKKTDLYSYFLII